MSLTIYSFYQVHNVLKSIGTGVFIGVLFLNAPRNDILQFMIGLLNVRHIYCCSNIWVECWTLTAALLNGLARHPSITDSLHMIVLVRSINFSNFSRLSLTLFFSLIIMFAQFSASQLMKAFFYGIGCDRDCPVLQGF